MNFELTPEQVLLRDTLRRFLRKTYSHSRRRETIVSPSGWRREIWNAFAQELGILGAALPARLGGLDGGAIETAIVMEEFGRCLVVEPYLESAVIGGAVLKHWDSARAEALCVELVAGRAIFALANGGRRAGQGRGVGARRDGGIFLLDGRRDVVTAAPWATHLIVSARASDDHGDAGATLLFVVDSTAPGVALRSYRTIDGRRAADVQFDNVRVERCDLVASGTPASALLDTVQDGAIVAVCAEAVGCMRSVLDETVAYARERRQFGVPIAGFQVLQHRMADMYMALEQSVSMLYMAVSKLDQGPCERMMAVSAAKAHIAGACRFVAQSAIQIHGAMGVSDGMAVGAYFKRMMVIENQFGTADDHAARYEALSFGTDFLRPPAGSD
ncbi:MAG TPA: acyl-CoA dehydrogenase [Rhizomicrobium sp.]